MVAVIVPMAIAMLVIVFVLAVVIAVIVMVFVLAIVIAVVVVVFSVILVPVPLSLPAGVTSPVGVFSVCGEWAVIAEVWVVGVIDVPVKTDRSVKPRSGAQEYPSYKPLRTVVTKRRTSIGRVVEIAVRADRLCSDMDVDADLCL